MSSKLNLKISPKRSAHSKPVKCLHALLYLKPIPSSVLAANQINSETRVLISSLKKKNLKNDGNASKGAQRSWCTIQSLFSGQSQRGISLSLCRATTNNKVREQALLELSFVNSDLQILKEELEGLNISVEVYQNTE